MQDEDQTTPKTDEEAATPATPPMGDAPAGDDAAMPAGDDATTVKPEGEEATT